MALQGDANQPCSHWISNRDPSICPDEGHDHDPSIMELMHQPLN